MRFRHPLLGHTLDMASKGYRCPLCGCWWLGRGLADDGTCGDGVLRDLWPDGCPGKVVPA